MKSKFRVWVCWCVCVCACDVLFCGGVCADKLKGFGNTILGKFGLSLDNFQMQKDPTTGSYSINFKQ